MKKQRNLIASAKWPQLKRPTPKRPYWATKGDTTTKRRIEIIVEKHRVLTISTRRISAVAWCSACGMRVPMVAAEDASRIAEVTPRTIYRRAEEGQLHFTESQDGLLLICRRSLSVPSTLNELSEDNEKEQEK